ncbi:DMT family transporter [Nisaea nitritireducens]|uniref:DMT family transporter n=1 Tax=Nisaea nitritireducens TaxID=568392 RepID=UPI0018688101|nr:DMT family transporter [Nisaea nitritireducens]
MSPKKEIIAGGSISPASTVAPVAAPLVTPDESPRLGWMYGAVCMTGGIGLVTLNDGIAKWLTDVYPVGQLIALRGVLVLVLIFGFAFMTGRRRQLRVTHWRFQLTRAAIIVLSTYSFIWALKLMAIADATAIAFAGPIVTAALVVPLLGEQVGWRRWMAILIGFCGVLIMVKPTPETFSAVALLPLFATVMGSFRDIVTRKMHLTESTLSMLAVGMSFVTLSGFASYPFTDWQPVAVAHILLFAVSSIFVGAAQFLMIEAFRYSEAGFVTPFKYTSMIWAVLIGFFVWGDVPDLWILGGTALVISSGLYILHRERVRRRQAQVASQS